MRDFILVLFGLAILIAAGESTLRGAVGLARRLNMPPAAIGLSVGGVGTSLPELVVSVQAAFDGRPGFAVGNAIGSNIANSLLILGAAALVEPLLCEPRSVRRDGAAMVAATAICIALGLSGEVAAWQGASMLILLVSFISWSTLQDMKQADRPAALHEKEADARQAVPIGYPHSIALLLAGFAGLAIGASTMVAGAAAIGSRIGIPDSVLGLTLFAFGTSLPELVAALVAAWRGHTDVAVGNVIGSIIFNILGILGAASLVAPVPFTESLRLVDIWVLLAATCVLFPILITGWRIRRTEGLALFLLYLGYIASVAWRTGQPGVGGAP